ncbi:cobalamin biosynthesis protein [Pseudomonas sp. GV071]|uniref:cobalamin biosynthesis protein n=1 Tax=Pseudomonas sp. GV071 TaxID=2135754 RepID=UPI000D3562EB|nr:cobalamin biosynthesis protein [Pseudomonas sp. GV071]PTQ73217.1 cobalt-precorrin 5A hydrolase [Pseudomonas sp. GV071]
MPNVAPYIAGIGCRAGCSEAELRQLLEQTLSANGLALADLAGLASLEHKCQEPGLCALALSLELPLAGFTAEKLQGMSARISAVSAAALRSVGAASVAEASALLQVEMLSGRHAALRIEKHSSAQATVAVAGVEEQA